MVTIPDRPLLGLPQQATSGMLAPMQQQTTSAFAELGPNEILAAIESRGYRCDGRLLALNSYENRVYRVGIEGAAPIIVKFYRPGRWSDAAILEEHSFAQQLATEEIPLVAPLLDKTGTSLFNYEQYRFSLYPMRAGRAPELDQPSHLRQLGRFLARLHNIGALQRFEHRPTFSVQEFGIDAVESLIKSELIPMDLCEAYQTLSQDLLKSIGARFGDYQNKQQLRLHGDCHIGNLLWQDDEKLFIVDLDDARNGPAIQDLWMFLSGEHDYMQQRLNDVLEGYSQFREFDASELGLLEPLRSLRIIWHAAWLAERFQEPAFQLAFPWFNSQHYWQQHILALREQLALLNEPPLTWYG